MKVLVTGGAGFIGSHVITKLLNEGHEVIVLDNVSTGSLDNMSGKVRTVIADVCDDNLEQQFQDKKIDAIIHLAAQVSVPKSINDPITDMQTNIEGTINMLQLAKKLQVESFVFSSTAAVYGNQSVLPIGENALVFPENPYGLSKLSCELYIKQLCKRYGIKYSILRYSNVYGPKQSEMGEGGVIKIFCESLLSNKSPIIYGNGEQTRDFIYVEDVATATVLALQANNKTMNVSSMIETSVNDVFQLAKNACNSHLPPHFAPARIGDIENSCLNNERIKKQLKWTPQFSMKQGMTKTINALKNN
jgi:UDP-glucose 4-epimerase